MDAVKVGRLKHVIQLQYPANTIDSMGQPVKTWYNYKRVWASIMPTSGKELMSSRTTFGGSVELSPNNTRFYVRYDVGITTLYKVVWRGKDYNIRYVNNVMADDRLLELVCDTGASNE